MIRQAGFVARRCLPKAGTRAVMLVGAGLLVGAVGCEEWGVPAGSEPHRELNFLDMADQPRGKAQRGDLVGGPDYPPAPGAIPRGYEPYPYAGQPELAARLKNPLPAGDPKVLERGKLMFERYCVPCHDPQGGGQGKVVEKGFPAPPSLMTQKVRDWPDGSVYHVISNGQNLMPSYAAQVRARDRWAIVHYLRQLQSKQLVAPPAPTLSAASAPAPSAAPPASASASPSGSVTPPGASARSARVVGAGPPAAKQVAALPAKPATPPRAKRAVPPAQPITPPPAQEVKP